ncbi:lactonase family protein [Streptomyces sp. NPDC059828]|uniref:lactonase family protein n=1 Tax=Streptomyces sp. NPDC059828 TaxID=3346965 RepID=UPI0036537BAB
MKDLSRRAAVRLTGGAVAGGAILRAGATGLTASLNRPRQRAYLGCYSTSGSRGIGIGSVDPGSGELTVDSWSDDIAHPSWLAMSPDRRTLYAVGELVPDGQLHTVHLDRAGRPAGLERTPTGRGPVHITVTPSGRHLLVALYDGGQVAVHSVLADGTATLAGHTVDFGRSALTPHPDPTESSDSPTHRPATPAAGPAPDQGTHDSGTSRPLVHQSVLDPVAARHLLVCDLGGDRIHIHGFDPHSGQSSPAGQTRLRAGSSPRHLMFHPNGRYVYTANEGDSTVTVCRWDARQGTLTPLRSTSTLRKPSRVRNHPSELVLSPDGRHLYVANRGDNSVAVFSVDGEGGRLILRGTPSSGGDWPRHLTVDATGRWLYVANQRSGEVVCFALDPGTGLPVREAHRLAVPAVSQVLLV